MVKVYRGLWHLEGVKSKDQSSSVKEILKDPSSLYKWLKSDNLTPDNLSKKYDIFSERITDFFDKAERGAYKSCKSLYELPKEVIVAMMIANKESIFSSMISFSYNRDIVYDQFSNKGSVKFSKEALKNLGKLIKKDFSDVPIYRGSGIVIEIDIPEKMITSDPEKISEKTPFFAWSKDKTEEEVTFTGSSLKEAIDLLGKDKIKTYVIRERKGKIERTKISLESPNFPGDSKEIRYITIDKTLEQRLKDAEGR